MMPEEQFEKEMARAADAFDPVASVAEEVMRRIGDVPVGAPLTTRSRRAGTIKQRILKMNKITRIAAAVFIVVAIGGGFVWLTVGRGGASIAWADVQTGIRDARTVCFRMTVHQGANENLTSTLMCDGRGRSREEMAESVAVIDWDTGRILVLVPEAKVAYSSTISDIHESVDTDESVTDWLAEMRRVVGSDQAEEVGEKEIEGHKVKGWRVAEQDGVVTVWADRRTAELVRVEFVLDGIETVLNEFAFDRKLDESLFSLESPKGYTVSRSRMGAADATIEDVVLVLRIWAGGNDGVFPDNILDQLHFHKAAQRYDWSKEAEPQSLSDRIGRGFWFIGMNRGAWSYIGKGVSLGAADKVVFWCRPKKSKTCKVIYGDLSIKDVAPADVPK